MGDVGSNPTQKIIVEETAKNLWLSTDNSAAVVAAVAAAATAAVAANCSENGFETALGILDNFFLTSPKKNNLEAKKNP